MNTSALVLHIPHASPVVPPEVRKHLLVSNEVLERELLLLTDHYTDDLFALDGVEAVVCPVSRLVVDVERFVDDEREPMATRGMGVIYERCSDDTALRTRPEGAERQALLDAYYRPHHRRLAEAVERRLAAHGSCLVLDCHSFPSSPLPCDLDQSPHRPDICLGTDANHTPAELLKTARKAFFSQGWEVYVDRPYSGALVPEPYWRSRDTRVMSLMVEVNRALYMDEATGEPLTGYRDSRDKLTECIGAV